MTVFFEGVFERPARVKFNAGREFGDAPIPAGAYEKNEHLYDGWVFEFDISIVTRQTLCRATS